MVSNQVQQDKFMNNEVELDKTQIVNTQYLGNILIQESSQISRIEHDNASHEHESTILESIMAKDPQENKK